MTFIEDNKNFINIKLHAEMKGLSDDEKLKKYRLENQEDTQKRLKKYYIKCIKKLDFYSEAFEYLSFFESDYLMLNLFLEKEANVLITFLSYNSFNNLNFVDKESISYNFWVFVNKNSEEDIVSEFLKTELYQLLGISENDWVNENKNYYPVITKYAEWLIKAVEDEVDSNKIMFTYILFSKLWNHFSVFNEQFNTKAIRFYNIINEKFDDLKNHGIFLNLNNLIIRIKDNQNELMVNEINYFPLLDNEINQSYSNGYIIQRDKFNERVKQSEMLCSSYIDKSYHFIFNLMINEEKVICNKLYHKDIVGKLNNFQFPDSEEIRQIGEIEVGENTDRLKNDFFRSLYIFEQL